MKIKYQMANNQISLPKKILSETDNIPVRLILNIGALKRDVKVVVSDKLPHDTIELSTDLFEWCRLPEDLEYEIRFSKRNLFIGPIIAFLAVSFKTKLTEETLAKLEKHYLHYEEIKGLVYVCSTNGINIANKTIEGVYYNPATSAWTKGVFPYPGAMYRRVDLPKLIYDDLTAALGNNIFNTYFFNKWDLWECLSQYPDIKSNLPSTSRLTSLADVDEMLNRYNAVYLKLISGYKAKGIAKVEKLNNKYLFTYRLKGETLLDSKDAENAIQALVKEAPYIIQQSIQVKKYENRNSDYRVILQKDKYEKWTCSGIIAKFGAINSIATNFMLNGFALPANEALIKVFGMSQKESFVKTQEIIQTCINACEKLDLSMGNYGDLGIDIIVDENKKVWILEINKLHDLKFPLYSINDHQMYHTVVTKPFEYAKSLAGFK